MYKAEVLADSLSSKGDRLITMKVTFPRIVLAEFNTHRMFSRNSASSRAIPFKKMVQMVEENPFIPIAWQKNHKGMQGTEYYELQGSINKRNSYWLNARDGAVKWATVLQESDTTKQLCNRLLEPFMWHTVIVTATEWENFFKLRCPNYKFNEVVYRSKKEVIKAYMKGAYGQTLPENDTEWFEINESQADIHIQAIAELMYDAYNESTPKKLQPGEWHIPFGDNIYTEKLNSTYLKNSQTASKFLIDKCKIKIATARCARISYQTLGDDPKIDYEADIKLHDMLAESGHWSPFEHVAKCMSEEEYASRINGYIQSEGVYNEEGIGKVSDYVSMSFPQKEHGWCRNFRGFIQYRALVDSNDV